MLSLVGIFLILGVCYFFSHDRKQISWRTVISGLLLQAGLMLTIFKIKAVEDFFDGLTKGVLALSDFASKGTAFVLGPLYHHYEGSFIFVMKVPAAIIFICSLMAVLTYLRILPPILKWTSWILQKIMGVSGAEILVNTSSALVGQVESALPLRPYLHKLSNSQLFAILTGGMSTMSISLVTVYADMGIPGKYLLAANLMGIPAGLIIAKMLFPSTKEENKQLLPEPEKEESHNIIESIVKGAQDGLKISLSIVAVLVAMIAVMALLDSFLSVFSLSLAQIFGWIFYPISVALGTPIEDASVVASIIGQKIALNEYLAFSSLLEKIRFCPTMDPKAIMIASFATCGFANFSSVAIQLGAFSEMLPERKQDLAAMGIPAMAAAALASWLSACWAGLLG